MAVPREMTRTDETTGRVGVSIRARYAVNIMITFQQHNERDGHVRVENRYGRVNIELLDDDD